MTGIVQYYSVTVVDGSIVHQMITEVGNDSVAGSKVISKEHYLGVWYVKVVGEEGFDRCRIIDAAL
jgi:hypothetical protein